MTVFSCRVAGFRKFREGMRDLEARIWPPLGGGGGGMLMFSFLLQAGTPSPKPETLNLECRRWVEVAKPLSPYPDAHKAYPAYLFSRHVLVGTADTRNLATPKET